MKNILIHPLMKFIKSFNLLIIKTKERIKFQSSIIHSLNGPKIIINHNVF